MSVHMCRQLYTQSRLHIAMVHAYCHGTYVLPWYICIAMVHMYCHGMYMPNIHAYMYLVPVFV